MRKFIYILSILFISLALLSTCCKHENENTDEAGGTDTTPPAKIELDTLSVDDDSISFTWTDPADSDFDYIDVSCAGSSQNVTSGTESCTISLLTADTDYEVSAKSVDTTGNQSEALVFLQRLLHRVQILPTLPLLPRKTSLTMSVIIPTAAIC